MVLANHEDWRRFMAEIDGNDRDRLIRIAYYDGDLPVGLYDRLGATAPASVWDIDAQAQTFGLNEAFAAFLRAEYEDPALADWATPNDIAE